MSQINPFIGSAIQATAVQRTQASEKDRQLRRSTELQKNAGLSGDRFEHTVESAESLEPARDEQKQNPHQKRPPAKKPPPGDEEDVEAGLDLKA